MIQVTLFLFLLITSSAKSKDGVSVIFLNNTNKDFRIFKANILGKEVVFKDLKKGNRTDIISVPRSCRYCYAQAITTTDTLLCQPEDYVGETVYTSGKILMIISAYSQKGLEKNIEVLGTWNADRFISTKN